MKVLRFIFGLTGFYLIYDIITQAKITNEYGFFTTVITMFICFGIGFSGNHKQNKKVKEVKVVKRDKQHDNKKALTVKEDNSETSSAVQPQSAIGQLRVKGNKFKVPNDILKVIYTEKDDLPLVVNTDEPLRIDKRLEVKKSFQTEILPYYPSYRAMSPAQRYKFLSWLQNIDNNIEIGYVFVLFYGLERRLLSGDTYPALDILKSLKRRFDNESFQDYSNSLLIHLSATHNDSTFLEDVNLERLKGESLLLVKYSFFGKASPDDLIQSSKAFGFTNHRYIKSEPEKFKKALRIVLEEKFDEPNFIFKQIDLSKLEKVRIAPLSNFSIPNERELYINDITSFKPLKDKLFEIMQKSHDIVKVQLRNERKK